MFECLHADILISLFEWFDRESLADLDSALTNRKLRPLYLSIFSLKECVVDLNLSLSDGAELHILDKLSTHKISLSKIKLVFLEYANLVQFYDSDDDEAELLDIKMNEDKRHQYNIDFNRALIDLTVSVLFQHCSHIQNIVFQGFPLKCEFLVNSMNTFYNLSTLSFTYSEDITDNHISMIMSCLPCKYKLTSIELRHNTLLTADSLSFIALNCHKVKKLTLCCDNILKKGQETRFAEFHQLEVVVIEQTCSWKVPCIAVIEAILGHSQQLKAVTLRSAMLKYVRYPESITTLSIIHSGPNEFKHIILSFLKLTPVITKLHFSTNTSITAQDYASLTNLSLKLRVFHTEHNDSLSVRDFLSSLATLETVRIGNNKIEGYGALFTALESSCRSLVSLSLSPNMFSPYRSDLQYDGTADEELVSLLSKCTNLTHLDMTMDIHLLITCVHAVPYLSYISLPYASGQQLLDLSSLLPQLLIIKVRTVTDYDVFLVGLTEISNCVREVTSHNNSGMRGVGYKALLDKECSLRLLKTGESDHNNDYAAVIDYYRQELLTHKPRLNIRCY